MNLERLISGKYGMLLLVVVHLLFVLTMIGLVLSKALLAIGFVGLLIISIAGVRDLRTFLLDKHYRPFLWLYTLFVYLIVSQLWGGEGWEEIGDLKGMVIFPWLVFYYRYHLTKNWKAYISILVSTLLVSIVITFGYHIGPQSIKDFYYSKGLIPDPSLLADQNKFGWVYPFGDRLQYAYLTVVIGLFYLLELKRFPVAFSLFALLFCLMSISGIGARGAQLGLIVSLATWAGYALAPYFSKLTGLRKSISFSIMSVSAILTFAVFSYTLYLTVEPVKQRYNQVKWEIETYQNKTYKPEQIIYYTSIQRYISWKHNLTLIKEKPLVGHGIGSYRDLMQELHEKDGLGFSVHSNQQYLYFGVAGGLIAILLFMASQLSLLWNARNSKYAGLAIAFTIFYFIVFLLDTALI